MGVCLSIYIRDVVYYKKDNTNSDALIVILENLSYDLLCGMCIQREREGEQLRYDIGCSNVVPFTRILTFSELII